MTVGNTAGVQAALRLQGVELRRYGRTILTEVDLEVPRGGKWVLFGPNGIGKSSLVQMMATRAFPSRGTVDVLGRRLGKTNVFSYRHLIGLSSAELARAFPPSEDPLDAVVTSLTATTGRWRDQYTDDEYAQARALMRRFGIDYLEGKAMRALSEGERTRVMLCRALMARSELLILDEPTEGIQPSIIEDIAAAIQKVNKEFGITVLIVEQYLDFVLSVSDRYYVMDKGEITLGGLTKDASASEIQGKMSIG